ncbi:unnamed protein product [Triticum turgidum subsp. durum]|uniref:RHOMBOID-like protein n=1 Tax=Triticum turgidum subsp. durum TaxID=4567 RepID=A0A9R0SG48_TRITD|nr:unnamed protein product [Triticum turgidum subsp. durum]
MTNGRIMELTRSKCVAGQLEKENRFPTVQMIHFYLKLLPSISKKKLTAEILNVDVSNLLAKSGVDGSVQFDFNNVTAQLDFYGVACNLTFMLYWKCKFNEQLLKMGALDVSKVVQGRQGWRLITCIWLHAGVVHLLINVLCLLFIGIRLEQEFGFVRIGLVYLISGFGGSLMSALFIRASISVGASGALFGLIGSMLSELITNWSLYANKVAALLTLVLVIVVNLALGILPRVDNFAHIGGLISGFLLGFVVFIRPQFAWINQRRVAPGPQAAPAERKHKTYQYILWIVAAVLLIVGFTVAIVLLFRGYNANDHCSWCHYLSCVPTKKWKCNSSPTTCTAMLQGNTLNLTCEGKGIYRSYIVAEATQDKIDQLCNQLCS